MKLERSYTSSHEVGPDRRVDFACSLDAREWPWIALGPRHPVVIQAQNFWASIGAAHATGSIDEAQWSALTWTDWRCGDLAAGNAVRGTYRRERGAGAHEDSDNFAIELFDCEDRTTVTMRGRGVMFRNRDFEQWRAEAKRKARARAEKTGESAPPAFASHAALGLGPGEHPLIAPPQDKSPARFAGMVTPGNGLPPANRVLSGSGDHVNTVHMVEAARQALCLLTEQPHPAIGGGAMTLSRYVELGVPFALDVQDRQPDEARFTLVQAGRECATITLRTE